MRNRLILSAVLILRAALAQEITTPEKFFGFQLGADKKMARWDKIVEYYGVIEKQSGGRMKVINMGPTSMGNPFLMVIITSPANFAKLDRLREVNLRLSDPRGLTEAQAHALVDEGKAVVVQSMSMHATEIGGTQMAPELAYDLLARKDEETRRILDNVIFIEVPCFNPDGEIMVTDWYNKQLGTPYEGTNPPWLYQKYAGHDNNRDAFQTNIPDSQYMAKILFTDWRPEAYVDHHGMGANGARIFLPPYAEPMRPFADPILWRELSWYGAHMAYKEEEANLSGAINDAIYSGWGHFGFHWITPFHNIAGMLTESAAARLATPQFVHPDELRGEYPQPSGVRSRDDLPQPVAGRMVASARHRGSAEGLGLGHARPGGAQSRDGAVERVSEGQAPDRARRGGQACGVSDLHAAARSAHVHQDDQQAAGAGHRNPAGDEVFHHGERHDVSGGLVRDLHGAAQNGADPLPAGPDLLSRQRVDAEPRRLAHPPLRYGDGHHVRIHGSARGPGG